MKFKAFYIFILSFLWVNNAYAASLAFFHWQGWGLIVLIASIIILIISPTKYRTVILGTILGLLFAYFTYMYIFPFLLAL